MILNNELSLRDSVLDSINHIDESYTDSTIACIDAMLESYYKSLDMIIIAKEKGIVIQEGFLDYDPGESKLKTFFLAIPRLILYLIRMMKEKWKKFKFETLIKQYDDRYVALMERINSRNIELNNEKMKYIIGSNPYVNFSPDGGFTYATTISNFTAFENFYIGETPPGGRPVSVKGFCEEYADILTETIKRDATDMIEKTFRFKDDIENIIRSMRSLFVRNDADRVIIHHSPEIEQYLTNTITYRKLALNHMDSTMKSVENLYSGAAKKTINLSELSAKQMLDDVRSLMISFTNVDTEFAIEVDNILSGFRGVIDRADAVLEKGLFAQAEDIRSALNAKDEEEMKQLKDTIETNLKEFNKDKKNNEKGEDA